MTKLNLSKNLLLLFSGLIPLTVYFFTAPTDLTLGIFGSDSGELITASLTGGIPHPSGYPSWLIASRIFASLPVGQTLAHRYNLFSAVCMSLAMLLLAIACSNKLRDKDNFAVLGAVLAVAFTLAVWSQAVITEVYALNGLLVSLVIYSLVKIESDRLSLGSTTLVGLICGLALTTHLTSVLLLPIVGLIFIVRRPPFSAYASSTLGFLIGLTPFLLLFWRANNMSPVIWGATDSMSGWWWHVSGAIYRPNVFALPAADMLGRIQTTILANPLNLIPLLLPIGALVGITTKQRSTQVANPTTTNYRLPVALLLTAALYTLYALSYNTNDWRVFLIPAIFCIALPLAYGLTWLNLKQWSLALPLLIFALNLPILLNGRADDTRQQAEIIFSQAPANAILLTDGRDETIFPIWYFRHAESIRPDTIIVDQNLFAFDWYRNRLATQHQELKAVEVDDLIAFRQQNSLIRPICEISLHPFAFNCTDG